MRATAMNRLILATIFWLTTSCQEDTPRSLQNEYATRPTVVGKDAIQQSSFLIEIPQVTYIQALDRELGSDTDKDFNMEAETPISDGAPSENKKSLQIRCQSSLENYSQPTHSQLFKLNVLITNREDSKDRYFDEVLFNSLCMVFHVTFKTDSVPNSLDVQATLYHGSTRIADLNKSIQHEDRSTLRLSPR